MLKKLVLCVFILSVTTVAFSQNIDSLKLTGNEVPTGYMQADELMYVTPEIRQFYEQPDIYESFLGKVKKKEFQSFHKKGDEGSVLYFEFETEFKGQMFLMGFLDAEKEKTKKDDSEYYAKGNILVIWNFKLHSELKKVSMAKVKELLK